MFEMPEKKVYSIVSKMMIAEELHGSWDQPTRTIVMHSLEATKVQSLAAQFADKATIMVELNERAYAFRTGGLRDDDDMGGGGRRGGGGGGRRGQDGQWEDEGGQGRRGGRGQGKLGIARLGAGQDQGRDQRRGGGLRDRSGFRGAGFGSSLSGSVLPDRFQRRTGFNRQQNTNMQALGSISRPGGAGGYNRGPDRRSRDL